MKKAKVLEQIRESVTKTLIKNDLFGTLILEFRKEDEKEPVYMSITDIDKKTKSLYS